MPRASTKNPRRAQADAGLIDPEQPWRYLDTEEVRDEVEERLYERAAMFAELGASEGYMHEVLRHFPGERELPRDGGWITILRPPYTVLDSTFPVRFGMTFWAMPWNGGVRGWVDRCYSVRISTPGGELRLWPYEYCLAPIVQYVEGWANGEVEFHPLEVDEQDLAPRLFYLHTRGLSTAEALPLALGQGEITGPVGWFEMKED